MQSPAPITFEVLTVSDGCYAVVVDGVCVMIYSDETEAVAHCEQLRRQSAGLGFV